MRKGGNSVVGTIKDYLKNNNYNGQGLVHYLNSILKQKAYWCACSSNGTSGIIRIGRQKYYFYCIKPWSRCPSGEIIVERVIK